MTGFLEFLAALLCILLIGLAVAGLAAVGFAVWLSGTIARSDTDDESHKWGG